MESPAAQPMAIAPSRADESTPRILVIDDNPSIHRDFDLVLLEPWSNGELEQDERELYGAAAPRRPIKRPYQLDHAFSGLEGVEKVRQAVTEERSYQLAFVDIRMPGIDGVETIERIWQIDPRIQMVICTAFADYSWDDLARRLGPTDKLLVLKKPFDTLEVTQLASTLSEKWFLARRAALKLEQMELLVAHRTQKLLDLQRREVPATGRARTPGLNGEGPGLADEAPVVLVVGATEEMARDVGQGLGETYRILTVTAGEQALHSAQETLPDLIITRLLLPDLEGLALCRCIKANELTSHIPIILLGADGVEGAQIKGLDAGADDYLGLPLSLALLKARAENLLRLRKQLQEHFSAEGSLQARDLAANQVDAQFLRRAIDTVERHLSDFEFDVEGMARQLALSRRQLFRKLKAVLGCTPNELLRRLRLQRAAQLLKDSQMTVTEITYAVGFSDLKHFRTLFREHFGVLPGEYSGRETR